MIEDVDTWLRLAETGGRFRFLDRVLGSYWVGDDGISAISQAQIEKFTATFQRHIERLVGADRNLALRCHRYYVGSMYLKLGAERLVAREYLRAASGLPTLKMKLKRAAMLLLTFL